MEPRASVDPANAACKPVRDACEELSRRLRAGENCSAEELLTAYPGITADLDSTLELLYTEFVVRGELGQNPIPDDWYRRFPDWREELEQLFQVHRFVADSNHCPDAI